jgi:preprotein translocase subunit SecB
MKYTLAGKAPALKLTVTVEQSGVDDEFSVAVPVEIQFGKAKPVTAWCAPATAGIFTIALRQAPAKVVLDPGNSVLAVKK